MMTKKEGIEEEEEQKTVNVNVDGVTWRRGEMIGQGGFGSVYLATLKKPNSQFPPLMMAVKSAELSVSRSLQKERKVLTDLQLPLQLQLQLLGGCPYIIQCFGEEITTGQKGEPVYNLLLEYASGGSLLDLIKKSGGFGLRECDVRVYTRSILRAIKHVHDCGYVHLDIKPDNILLVEKANKKKFVAKLGDFGLAKMVKQIKKKSELSGYVRGTAMYLSPESVVDGIQEAPSDIWAVGCVVLEMLTAKHVWDRKLHWNTDKLLYNIGYEFDIPQIPSGISEEAKDFLNGCFVRNPADRLTAAMLLKLPFVSQADDDADDHEDEDTQVQVMNLKKSLAAQGVSAMLSLSETDDKDDSWLVEPTMISEDKTIDSLLVEPSIKSEEEEEPSICYEYNKECLLDERGVTSEEEEEEEEEPSICYEYSNDCSLDKPSIISEEEEEEEEEPSICFEYNNDCLLDEPGIISEDEEEPSICPSSEAEAFEDEHNKQVQVLEESPDTQGVRSMSETDNDSDEEESCSDEEIEEEDEDHTINSSSEEEEDEDHTINSSSEEEEDVDDDNEDAEAEVLKKGRFDPKEVNSRLCMSDSDDDESWSDESSFVPEDHKRRSPVVVAVDDETTQDHKRRKLIPTSSVGAWKQMMIEHFVGNHQPKPVNAIIPQEPPSISPITSAH